MRLLTKSIIALVLLAATAFSATSYVDRGLEAAGLEAISESNDAYLKESFDTSLKGFLVLSAIKSGVAVLEGSEVGVGFNLEVGDVVQSVYDYVDVAWKTSLAGCTVLLLMRIVLTTIGAVQHWFLFGALGACLMLYLARWWMPGRVGMVRTLKEGLFFLSSLAIALYIILPVSIAGASYLSRQITRPLVAEAHVGFESVQRDLSPDAMTKRMFPDTPGDEGWWSKLSPGNAKEAMGRMSAWLATVTRDFAVWTIKLIAGYVFDCIVFPLAFFVVAYILTRALLGAILGVSRRQSMRADLEAVLRKFLSASSVRRAQMKSHIDKIPFTE